MLILVLVSITTVALIRVAIEKRQNEQKVKRLKVTGEGHEVIPRGQVGRCVNWPHMRGIAHTLNMLSHEAREPVRPCGICKSLLATLKHG